MDSGLANRLKGTLASRVDACDLMVWGFDLHFLLLCTACISLGQNIYTVNCREDQELELDCSCRLIR